MTAATTTEQPTTAICGTCNRKRPQPMAVCDGCRTTTTSHLNDLPDLLTRLEPALQPAPAGLVEYVSGGAFRSTPPAALDPLNALTVPPHTVLAAVADPVPPERDTPPALWAIMWAAVWRARLGHHPPAPARGEPNGHRDRDLEGLRRLLGYSAPAAYRPVVHPDKKQGIKYQPGEWLDRPPVDDRDPAETAWHLRHGSTAPTARLTRDLNYLHAWFTHAADHFDDTPTFVRDLRRHITTVRALLGETTGRTYLGLCPEIKTDEHGDEQTVVTYDETGAPVYELARCAAPIYRDPNLTPLQVECRTCGTRTPERGLLNLALRMRTAWGEMTDREAWTR